MKIDCHQHFWRYNTKEFSWIGDNMDVLKRDFFTRAFKTIASTT